MGSRKSGSEAGSGRCPVKPGRRGILRPGFPRRAAVLAAVLVLFSLTVITGCGGEGKETAKVRVAADIVPLAQLCRSVGGEMVEVEVLVPPGSSPHTYELTSGQMKYLSQADVLVLNGLGLAPWAEEVFSRVENPGLRVIRAGETIPEEELILVGKGSSSGGGGGEGIYDPHVWLDPVLMAYVVEAIRDGLAAADPGHASSYRENASSMLDRLDALHEEIERRTAGFTRREFIAFHSSWTYFARRYGLRQVGVIEEQPGKEPSSGQIADLVDLARKEGVKSIFAEYQFNPRVAEAVAEESEGEIRVWVLDPLGDLEDPGRSDYCSLMRFNLEIMEEALR